MAAINRLNRALLRTIMTPGAAKIVADRLQEMEKDAAERRAILEQMSGLLNRIADAVKGPAPEGTLHDWSDIPERCAALVKDRDYVAADFIADALVRHGVVQAAAIEDPEGYDRNATVNAVCLVAAEINARITRATEGKGGAS